MEGGHIMRKFLVSAALIALAGSAMAQDLTATRVKPEELRWSTPPFLAKGLQIAVVLGDPTKAGEIVVVRVKIPPNFQLAPHTHPYAETVTVLSGSVGFGIGEKFDKTKGELVKAGALNAVPAKQPHFVWTEGEEALVEIHYIGPSGIGYVNPADDPRKK